MIFAQLAASSAGRVAVCRMRPAELFGVLSSPHTKLGCTLQQQSTQADAAGARRRRARGWVGTATALSRCQAWQAAAEPPLLSARARRCSAQQCGRAVSAMAASSCSSCCACSCQSSSLITHAVAAPAERHAHATRTLPLLSPLFPFIHPCSPSHLQHLVPGPLPAGRRVGQQGARAARMLRACCAHAVRGRPAACSCLRSTLLLRPTLLMTRARARARHFAAAATACSA